MQTLEFTCPKCGHHALEEIMVDVVVSSTLHDITIEDGVANCEYAEQTNEDGNVNCYQCGDCGEVLRLQEKDMGIYKVSSTVTNLEELARWFEQNKG